MFFLKFKMFAFFPKMIHNNLNGKVVDVFDNLKLKWIKMD